MPLFAPEASTEAVTAIIDDQVDIVVSDFGIGEVSSAISKKYREHILTREQALLAFAKIDMWAKHAARTARMSNADVSRATVIVRDLPLKLRFPDALQLALTERLGANLLTRDRLMAAAAEALSLQSRYLP